MSETHGFMDLRVGHGAGGIGDDSVWPSFTDIMTVIVMIFLMALMVIMVRNFELDRELLFTTTAKDATTRENQDLMSRLIQIEAALIDSKSEKDVLEAALIDSKIEKDVLKANLSVALKRLSALLLEQQALAKNIEKAISERGQLEQTNTLLEQQKEAAQLEISALTKSEQTLSQQIQNLILQLSTLKLKSAEQIASLTEDKQSLGTTRDAISDQLAEVQRSLQQSRSKNVTLTQEATELKISGQAAGEEILALIALIKQRGNENEALLAQATTSAKQFRSLQAEYEALDAKYRTLIRPARNTAGKQVATVWIKKTATGLQYKMTQSGQSEPQIVEQQQMHRVLQTLKEKFGNQLYIRVVIPKNSGLSYDEAANATQEMLQKYDYYSQ